MPSDAEITQRELWKLEKWKQRKLAALRESTDEAKEIAAKKKDEVNRCSREIALKKNRGQAFFSRGYVYVLYWPTITV